MNFLRYLLCYIYCFVVNFLTSHLFFLDSYLNIAKTFEFCFCICIFVYFTVCIL
ncbi:conserved hypothetical protein [Listeria monocytogenes]|nr:conserved hypothetical protein [Listeria monocytogenes]GAT39928.1 conserved hypothetical protein [Listeria monocytogenes]